MSSDGIRIMSGSPGTLLWIVYSAEPVVQKRAPDGRYQGKDAERGEDFDSTHSGCPGAP